MKAKPRTYTKKYNSKPKVSKPVKQYVAKAIEEQKELNWVDQFEPSGVEMSYDSVTFNALFPPSQGDTIATRDGDRIEPIRLFGQYAINIPSVTTICRVFMFQWKPDNAVDAPSMAKIFEDSASTATVTSNYVGDAVLRKKFKVLYDKVIVNPTSVVNAQVFRKFDIKSFNNKYIYFNTGSTNGKNQVYVLLISNIPVAGTGPTMTGHFRSQWKD